MSRKKHEKIICPKCKNESEFVVWDSINTMIDPDMKKSVRNGQAFMFQCPQCNAIANIDYGFLYHQMEDQIIIQYVQDEEAFNKAYEVFTGESEISREFNTETIFDGYLKRIVVTQNQLREKLAIFDAGLDDRIIEMVKLVYISEMEQNHSELSVDEALMFTNDEGKHIIEFMFEGQGVAAVELDSEIYASVEARMKSRIPDIKEDDIVIDMDWAVNKLQVL